MNRFTPCKKTSFRKVRRAAAAAVVFVCAAAGLFFGTAQIRRSANDSQMESLRLAILRSAIHCYAVEGAYPESLDDICAHYGISWDTDRYLVDYEVTGANLMPDVTVFPLRKEG